MAALRAPPLRLTPTPQTRFRPKREEQVALVEQPALRLRLPCEVRASCLRGKTRAACGRRRGDRLSRLTKRVVMSVVQRRGVERTGVEPVVS